jgi:hypothetical protein
MGRKNYRLVAQDEKTTVLNQTTFHSNVKCTAMNLAENTALCGINMWVNILLVEEH